MNVAALLEQARAGTIRSDDIDVFVARSHQREGELTLREFLGLTDEEYSQQLREPNGLDEIIGATPELRMRHRSAVYPGTIPETPHRNRPVLMRVSATLTMDADGQPEIGL